MDDGKKDTGYRSPVTGHGKVFGKGSDIAERLLDFGLAVLGVAERLPRTYAGRHVGQQLIRAATGGGANYAEARAAESRADFVHKLGVAAKEMSEAHYWLSLCIRANWLPPSLAIECNHLASILASSARTARANSENVPVTGNR